MPTSAMTALATVLTLATGTAQAAPLTDFVDGQSIALEGKQWDGQLRFAQAFCGTFPRPHDARERTTALLNNATVAFSRVMYPDRYAYIVSSTLPDGRSAEQEYQAQRTLAEQTRQQLASQQGQSANIPLFDYHTNESRYLVTRQYRNVVPETDNAERLFPLEPVFSASTKTVSVARSHVFPAGTNRIEVAVLAAATDDTAEAVQKSVNAEADALLESVRSCTQSLLDAR